MACRSRLVACRYGLIAPRWVSATHDLSPAVIAALGEETEVTVSAAAETGRLFAVSVWLSPDEPTGENRQGGCLARDPARGLHAGVEERDARLFAVFEFAPTQIGDGATLHGDGHQHARQPG